ncbi:MAG: hypothetical protein WC533_03590 [Candidatus Pacearchaeota archaeon]
MNYEEKVQAEIDRLEDEYPGEGRVRYMNNFPMVLPGGRLRKQKRVSEEIIYRVRAPSGPESLISNLMIGKTWREYFDAIDEVILELGVDSQQIISVVEERKGALKSGDMPLARDIVEELFDLVQPIFVKLMERGYNRYDLKW